MYKIRNCRTFYKYEAKIKWLDYKCASKWQCFPETYQSCSFQIQCRQLQLLLPDPLFWYLEIWLQNSLTFLEGWQPFANDHQSSAYFLAILLIVLSLSEGREVCIRQMIKHKRRKKTQQQLFRTEAFDQWKLIKKTDNIHDIFYLIKTEAH